MEDSQILELLKAFEVDNEWFSKNYEELKKRYEGKAFTIKNKKIIHESESVQDLLKELEKKGEDRSFLLLETIPPRNVSFIL